MSQNTHFKTHLPGLSTLKVRQFLNRKYGINLEVAFAIPAGDQSVYLHDPSSGSVAIFGKFGNQVPTLVYFCLKSQIFQWSDLAALQVELQFAVYPPGETSPGRSEPGLWFA